MENIFQRPPILMRLTMLTRDKMSLLRAASLRTAWETACGLNDRKQKGWVEAGILPLNYSRSSGFHKPGKQSHLLTTPKLARVTIYILALTIIVLIYLIKTHHNNSGGPI